MRRTLGKTLVASLAAVLLVPLAGANVPASAAVAAPVLNSPAAGATVYSNPQLTWTPLPDAKKYDVQVATVADFTAGVEFSQSTLNSTATPPNDLAVGTHYWRVRAYDNASVAGSFSAARTFEKANAAAPGGLAPPEGGRAGGLPLRYGLDPLILSWEPMPGMKTYEVQIDDDPAFVGAPAPTSTNNTSYTPVNPPLGTTYYWHVRGKSSSGVPTQYSEPRSYSMTWTAKPALTTPENVESPTIEEIVLKWDPMPGASAYELQISPDVEFNAPIGGTLVVNGTSFAPSPTLHSGSFYWRVRGLTTANTPEPSDWSATWVFTHAWPAATANTRPRGTEGGLFSQVTLISPANGNYASFRQPTFSWNPQREASHYEFWIGSDANFSPGTYAICQTNHTTFTSYRPNPTYSPMCPATPGQVSYWKVRAVDGPAGSPVVYGVFSETRSFLYDPTTDTGGVVQVSPADGATVPVPVLTWQGVDNVAKYKVTIDPSDPTCSTITATTYNTTYVPETLKPSCAGAISWTVQAYESNGGLSRLPLDSWPRFSLAPAAGGGDLEPVTSDSNADDPYRPPLIRWQPRTGALTYTVWVSVQGANSYSRLHTNTVQPALAFTGFNTVLSPLLPPGDYDYYVRAYSDSGGNTLLGQSEVHSFHVAQMPTTVLSSPANCPVESQNCPVRHDTPTLDWEPVRGAGAYLVYLATDPNFTNITRTWLTQYDTLTPVESLPDSQAGQATYWFVRPCYNSTACGQFDAGVFGDAYAFRKRSFPVETISPAKDDVVADEVTFTWKDYLTTNQEKQGEFGEVVTQEARNYKVQVSTTAEFTNIIETSPLVDQTRYEAQTRTYPDGPLFWRVQAYDASNNPLTFSEPIAFSKQSPGPTPTLPANGAQVSSAPWLSWEAKTFAKTYEVEAYKNPDSPLSVANRVISISTRATAAIPTTPLAPGVYGWRVRRLDTNGLPSAWSADNDVVPLRRFTVNPTAADLISPVNGATVSNNNLVLRWTSVPSATRYLVESSVDPEFLTRIETVTTDMTSWAPGLVSPVWPNQTIYWRVTTLDAAGQRLATSPAQAVVGSFVRDASTTGEFTAVSPYRLLDTRLTKQPIGPAATRTFRVTGGASGVPASGVSSVVMNVTVTAPTAAGSLIVYPANLARPKSGNVNFAALQTVPGLVTVGVDGSGQVNMYNTAGTSHVILDIVGYYSGGTLPRATRFVAASSPTRILETRAVGSQPARPLGPRETRTIAVAGQGGVPAGATSVVMNVTAVTPTAAGFLTVYPAGVALPTASNLNYVPKVTVPNLVSVRLGTGGKVNLYNYAGLTHVLFDVVGWYVAGDPGAGSRFNPLTAPVVLDTRLAGNGGKLAAATPRSVQIRGAGGVPSSPGVTAVALTVTVTQPAGAGYASVYPSGVTRPTASNLNYLTGKTISNLVVVSVGADGKVNLFSLASTHAVVAVAGWFNR